MSKKKIKFTDPYAEQEKQRYENPIPSRQSIVDYLTRIKKSVSLKHLIKVTELKTPEAQDALFFRLKAMLRDGQVMQDKRNRYCALERLDLIEGRVTGHPDGFGFILVEEGDDLFLSAKEMRSVMHGDVVRAFEIGRDRRGRKEGRVYEVLNRANTTVVGQLYAERGIFVVEPDNKRLTQALAVAKEDLNNAKPGQIVLLEIITFPTRHRPAIGRVIDILGDHLAPGLEVEVALHSHEIPNCWPPEVLDEVSQLPTSVTEAEIVDRRDLRDLPFVTIDGEDARDFDDAVFCRKREKTWQLMVAIADVSHYVKPGSALDKEAQCRSTSVYFPGRVIPMLPEQLSNGLCSLNPQVDRLVLVCDMSFSPDGKIKRSRFYRAVIHSKARLTYTKVAKFIEAPTSGVIEKSLAPHIENLYGLYNILGRERKNRGAIEFDTTETQILFDENKKISQVVPLIRNVAHRLIEESMLAANVCAAKFVKREKVPSLYRVHQTPPEDKINKLREFLSGFGLTLGGGKKPHPKEYATVLTLAEEKAEKKLIETVMLRSLTQARYMEKNDGHFGLAYAAYAHFTSPIRRYPDLLTHRAILHALDKRADKVFTYTDKDMAEFGKHASSCERRADEATREVVTWLKCEYMQDKVGQSYQGTISAVTSFGLFVTLDEIHVDGLVHLTNLKGDYYQFDSVRHRLIGEATRKQYRLGDKLQVLVARVDLDERKIDFDLVD